MARYLSRADLSRIAGKYIDQCYTRFRISKDALEPIDPERLASAVLGLNVKMLPLCSDGSVLGLTVFQRCGFTVTLGDGTKLVEIFMPKDVVMIHLRNLAFKINVSQLCRFQQINLTFIYKGDGLVCIIDFGCQLGRCNR